MKRLAFFLVGVALAGLMLLPYSANAAITLTPSVEGLGGGTFKPLAIPSLAGNNFAATGKVLVNGKWVNIPGYIPPASTAAQAARTSLWLNPWLVGAALLTWADDAGLGSDQVGGWQVTVPGTPSEPGTGSASCSTSAGTGYGDTYAQACEASLRLYYPYWCPSLPGVGGQCHVSGSVSYSGGQVTHTIKNYCNSAGGCVGGVPYGGFVYDQTDVRPGTVGGTESTPAPTTRPATQADFDALPAPSPEVYRELAPQVGVPVDAPVYEPATVPVGDPYTKPDGSTAQPMAQISPASNGQVTVDVYEMPLTDPQGNPVNDPQPQDTPEPQPTDCDKYPTSVGCTDLGTPPLGEDMPHTEQPITFTPVPISANATCPAPITVNGFGQTLTIDYSSACTYASGLRPIVIAIGYLTALFIIFGVPRSAQS